MSNSLNLVRAFNDFFESQNKATQIAVVGLLYVFALWTFMQFGMKVGRAIFLLFG